MTQLFLVQFTLQHRRYSPNCLPPFDSPFAPLRADAEPQPPVETTLTEK